MFPTNTCITRGYPCKTSNAVWVPGRSAKTGTRTRLPAACGLLGGYPPQVREYPYTRVIPYLHVKN